MRRMTVLLLALAVTAGLSGCVERVDPVVSSPATTAASTSTQALTVATAPVTNALTMAAAFPAQLVDLEIQDEAGTKLNLKEKAMGKPSILIFWASW